MGHSPNLPLLWVSFQKGKPDERSPVYRGGCVNRRVDRSVGMEGAERDIIVSYQKKVK